MIKQDLGRFLLDGVAVLIVLNYNGEFYFCLIFNLIC